MDISLHRDYRKRCIMLSRSLVAIYVLNGSRGSIWHNIALVSLMSGMIIHWVRCKGLEMLQGFFKTLESVRYIICEPVEENSE